MVMSGTEPYYVESLPVRKGDDSNSNFQNIQVQLEERVRLLERELRLIHRKLRSYELSRYDLIKGAVIEVLNAHPMSITFNLNSNSYSTEAEASTLSKRGSRNKVASTRSRLGNNSSNDASEEEDQKVTAAGEEGVRTKRKELEDHSWQRKKVKSSERQEYSVSIGSQELIDDEEMATDMGVSVLLEDFSSCDEVSPPPDYEGHDKKPKHISSMKTKRKPNSRRKSMDGGGKKPKSFDSGSKPKRHIVRCRNNYSLFRKFDSRTESEDFLKGDVNCRLRTRKEVPGGVRAFYNCKNELTCPFRMSVFYPSQNGQQIEIFQTPEPHNHHHSTTPFGIPQEERDEIKTLANAGMNPSVIIQTLLEKGYPKLNKTIVENFYSTLQKSSSITTDQ